MPPDLPRFVPTLTEVVDPAAEGPPAPPASEVRARPMAPPPPALAPVHDALPVLHPPGPVVSARDERRADDDVAEQIAHRVLQRVDAVLAERLSEAVRQVVVRHTQTLLPAVREEIVMAVHAAVAEALADEFLPPDGGVPA
ncbi:hypothetical protein GN316_03295 [Xylophilus sp. Kf1]|nr:hypothetical protein [Xylophilus sp. Kf1]